MSGRTMILLAAAVTASVVLDLPLWSAVVVDLGTIAVGGMWRWRRHASAKTKPLNESCEV